MAGVKCDRCETYESNYFSPKFRKLSIYPIDKNINSICLCNDCYDKFKDFMEELGICELFE